MCFLFTVTEVSITSYCILLYSVLLNTALNLFVCVRAHGHSENINSFIQKTVLKKEQRNRVIITALRMMELETNSSRTAAKALFSFSNTIVQSSCLKLDILSKFITFLTHAVLVLYS